MPYRILSQGNLTNAHHPVIKDFFSILIPDTTASIPMTKQPKQIMMLMNGGK